LVLMSFFLLMRSARDLSVSLPLLRLSIQQTDVIASLSTSNDDCLFLGAGRPKQQLRVLPFSRRARADDVDGFASEGSLPASCRHSCFGALLNGSTHHIAPLGPRAVVVRHVAISQ